VDTLNTSPLIWLSAKWASGRKKTEEKNKIKTTIKYTKKAIRAKKKEKKEKIVKNLQQLPYGKRRHLRICLQKVLNRKQLGKSAFQSHQLVDVEYVAIITSHVVENLDC